MPPDGSENKPMVKVVDAPPPKNPAAYESFGKWLAAMTKVHGSKARLALAIGTGGQDINGWINGKRPGPEKLRAIAAHFEVNYLDLVAFWDPMVREAAETYSAGSSPELRGVHSVPIKGQLSPVYGGIWMNTSMPDMLVGVRVLWNETAPELYAYKIAGDELEPRYHAGEFLIMDPRAPEKAGEEMLVEHVDGRRAVLVFIAREGGRISFHRIGFEPRTLTLEESEIDAMHWVSGHQKSAHWMDITGFY